MNHRDTVVRAIERDYDRTTLVLWCGGVGVLVLLMTFAWAEYMRAKARPAIADSIAADYRECVRENAGALARMQCEVAAFELADAQEPGRLTAAVAERIRAMRHQP